MTRQDAGVREPRVRLRLLLVLMRLLAGRRGHASVTWRGAGFTYALTVTRSDGSPAVVDLDADPGAEGGETLAERVRDALRVLP